MSYKVSDQRTQTMLKRLGEAAQLVDNKAFLPFYRSVQLKLEREGHVEEWGKMIAVALTKDKPSHYFAKLCKMVRDETYKFVEKVQEVVGAAALWIDDKLVKFGFGKYQAYWRRKAQEFIRVNGQGGFVELLEYADRKNINQKQMATAIKNCKPPQKYYKENVLGVAS